MVHTPALGQTPGHLHLKQLINFSRHWRVHHEAVTASQLQNLDSPGCISWGCGSFIMPTRQGGSIGMVAMTAALWLTWECLMLPKL